MGDTCKPMADSFQCMTKSTTIKKKKERKEKKKRKVHNSSGEKATFFKISKIRETTDQKIVISPFEILNF